MFLKKHLQVITKSAYLVEIYLHNFLMKQIDYNQFVYHDILQSIRTTKALVKKRKSYDKDLKGTDKIV